jgi:hypothetical protein
MRRRFEALLSQMIPYHHVGGQDWRDRLALYRLCCVLELWCWFAQIGNHEPPADLTRTLNDSHDLPLGVSDCESRTITAQPR